MNNNVNVFNLSGEKVSSVSAIDDVEFKSYKHRSDEEYRKVLTSAFQEGIAIVIEGDEPSEDELIRIKAIYDKNGSVKIFRKKRLNKFRDSILIKPSRFKMINGGIDSSVMIKDSVCGYISNLIKNLGVT